jgi:amidase
MEEVALPSVIGSSATIDYYLQDMAGIPGREVVETLTELDELRTHMLQFMQDYDAILCPAGPTVAPPFRDRDPQRFAYTLPFSLTGYPCAVVRAGQSADSRPIGAQLVARPWHEDVTLALAKVLEEAFGGWQRPGL